jgi:hypothetical protein
MLFAGMLVSSSVSVTFAPGITAPEGSLTTPVNWEVYVDCASARLFKPKLRRMNANTIPKHFGNLRKKLSIPQPLNLGRQRKKENGSHSPQITGQGTPT